MNFLAHIALSNNQPELMLGNFIADTLPMSLRTSLPMGIQQGVELHLKIDSYTDQHPEFRDARKLLFPYFRHYAAVVLDIFNDYFLHKHWSLYFSVSLDDTVQLFYNSIQQHYAILPPEVQRLCSLVQSRNWLYKYAYISGLDEVFQGMDKRTQHKGNMLPASKYLLIHELELDKNFQGLMSDLCSYASGVMPKTINS